MISAGEIRVYSYLNISRVVDFSMGIKSGEHGRVTLRGYLAGLPSAVALQEEPVRITVQGSGEAEQLLFQGVIQDAITFYENGVCQVILSALTNDVKLDRKEKSRSFQDKSDTYARIMKEAAGSMDGEVRCSHPPVQTGHPVIQFQETDWEFCRRMASSLGLAVYSDPLSPVPALEVGLVEKGGGISLSSSQYRVCVDEAYYRLKGDGESRKDFLYYEVESEENHEIGESAHYRGKKQYIFEKTAETVNGTLLFRYKLGGKSRFAQAEYGNRKIAGASLRGKVEKREGQTVFLKLEIDGEGAEALYPYPWAPATGNMMYCMPREGAEAFLYFPDADEGNACAVSGIHGKDSCPGFADVQNRRIVTGHGKQLQMYPDRLCFLGGKGEEEQECLLGKETLRFRAGAGKLQITGKEGIYFRAPEIRLAAAQKIGQYKMESLALQKEGELHPRGSGNPATGGGGGAELQNEYNALAAQGILSGTAAERYAAFDDAPDYEAYKEVPLWAKIAAGVAAAVVVGVVVGALVVCTGGAAAVVLGTTAVQLGLAAGAVTAGAGIAATAATAAHDAANGTESSMEDYVNNALSASTRVGGAILALVLALPAADMAAMLVTGGNCMIPVGGSVLTLQQARSAFQLLGGMTGLLNLGYQEADLMMFCFSGKPIGAPTGNRLYDAGKELSEIGAAAVIGQGLANPYAYSKVTVSPLPGGSGLAAQGGGLPAVVPGGKTPAAVMPAPYFPAGNTGAASMPSYPPALPGGSSSGSTGIGIQGGSGAGESGSKSLLESTPNEIANMTRKELQESLPEGWDFQNHNGRIHIKDENGNYRVRIDPPDKKTNYTHIHIMDENKNPLDINGNIVSPKDPSGHIPYND